MDRWGISEDCEVCGPGQIKHILEEIVASHEKIKICPKCKNTYPDTDAIEYCVCGHKFELTQNASEKVLEDLFGFDIREELNRK